MDDETLASCVKRWGFTGDIDPPAPGLATIARFEYRRKLDPIREELQALIEECADEMARELAREVFLKARPDAAKSWDSLAEAWPKHLARKTMDREFRMA